MWAGHTESTHERDSCRDSVDFHLFSLRFGVQVGVVSVKGGAKVNGTFSEHSETFRNIQGTFSEHSETFKEHSETRREHSEKNSEKFHRFL
jgi:hypothetical protein